MDTAEEESYIQLATRSPNMLCSDLPFEILEACSFADNEPTEFTAAHRATERLQLRKWDPYVVTALFQLYVSGRLPLRKALPWK